MTKNTDSPTLRLEMKGPRSAPGFTAAEPSAW